MSYNTPLNEYRDFITGLWNNERLNEEEIICRLQDQCEHTIDFFELHTCLEQWEIIPPPPSPTHSYLQEPSAVPHEEQYNPPQQQLLAHSPAYYPEAEAATLPNNRNTGLTPLERYTQDKQSHELLAVRLSSLHSSTPNRSRRTRKGEQGRKKKRGGEARERGQGGGGGPRNSRENRGKASGEPRTK